MIKNAIWISQPKSRMKKRQKFIVESFPTNDFANLIRVIPAEEKQSSENKVLSIVSQVESFDHKALRK